MGVRDTIAKAVMGIKAYHSSPHDFDKFDLKKIGTGEGAQAYGHGLYFAENPAVSGQGGQYWDQFKRRFNRHEQDAADLLRHHGFDRQSAIDQLDSHLAATQMRLSGAGPKANTEGMEAALRGWGAQRDLLAAGNPVGPRTYEVNIKADPAQMLDWDKPLREQQQVLDALSGSRRKAVKETLERQNYLAPTRDSYGTDIGPVTGQDFYKALSYNMTGKPGAAQSSQAMQAGGIPGIKYLDEGSRNLPQGTVLGAQQTPQGWVSSIRAAHPSNFNGGTVITKSMPFPDEAAAMQWATEKVAIKPTSNYVVFDPANIDILKKYGIAGAAAAPVVGTAMGSTYDQGSYQEPDPMQGTFQ